ncbi:MAG TPA: DUF2723 domain-containing protein [Candidatus Baltobacteraceae bacterium]|nr:DUF2723 domain-containing protein [Candidatus Baltobacteraceae bacterium]
MDAAFQAAAFLLPLAIYCRSASSDPASWDTAEMQSVPYVLGIAHPTGFPLYTLLGWIFSHVFALGTVAYRLNVFSAMAMSAACLAIYVAAVELRIARPVALAASLWFSVTDLIWVHAARAEVHDLALALSAFSVLYGVRYARTGNSRALFSMALCWGLALATHPIAVWLVFGVCAAIVLAPRRTTLRELGSAGLIVFGCLLLYAYLPLRSAYIVTHGLDPTVALSGAAGSIVLNYNDPSHWNGFVTEITGSQFGAREAIWSALTPASLGTGFGAWIGALNTAYGAAGIALAVGGLAALLKRDWRTCLTLTIACVAAVPFSYSYAGVEGDPDRYRLLSLWLVPVLMAGAAVKLSWLDGIRSIAAFVLIALFAGQTYANNQEASFANRDSAGGRNTIAQAARRIPPGAIVVAPWIDATSLAYGEFVDGTFAGRVVVPAWPPDFANDYSAWDKARAVYFITPPKLAIPGWKLDVLDSWDSTHVLYRLVRPRLTMTRRS